MKISFIGVGAMGGGMAMNLVRAGYDVQAIATKMDRLWKFRDAGARVSTNTLDAADSDIIFFCLPDVDVVSSVLFGTTGSENSSGNGKTADGGLLAQLHPGQIVVDCSTIGYLDAKAMGEACEAAGIGYMDAPVSGHQNKAEDGTLTIMCGGKTHVYNTIYPVLQKMGTTILHMGDYGSGQLTKMINNCALNICAASVCELMPLGVKLGLSPEKLGQVLMTASGSSYASRYLIPGILKGDFGYNFTMDKAYKDMVNMTAVTTKYQVPLPTLQGTMQTYQMALLHGEGDLYKGAMIRFYEDLLGVECRRKEDILMRFPIRVIIDMPYAYYSDKIEEIEAEDIDTLISGEIPRMAAKTVEILRETEWKKWNWKHVNMKFYFHGMEIEFVFDQVKKDVAAVYISSEANGQLLTQSSPAVEYHDESDLPELMKEVEIRAREAKLI